ncbi:MAG: hybrid sensor histidine kinase/response regulator, partial [Caulobacteraceae bacterium]|nr:hybrid sensor histidine kinase/response regulator [Caulobacteraceae bacterium]
RMANAALAAARRGERLTRQLLAFSRRQELKLDVADIGDLIAQIEPLIRRAANEMVSLSIEIEPEVGHARLDPAQFEAALLNLVVNAADATPAGQSIVVSAGRVRLSAGERAGVSPGDYVRVLVADTGSGMSRDVLARVFEPFFTTKEVGKGTGLGLAQVYGFARQAGGAVDIVSAPGEGTSVALFLPSVEAPPARDEAPPEPQLAGAIGVRLLLVEDDDGVRQVVEAQLADLGCRVVSEPNAIHAKARLDSGEEFDLLLSDIVMPGGMSGLDLAAYVETLPQRPLILLTSGYAGDGAQPVDAPWPVLRKPFSGDQLAAALHATLQTRSAA